LWACGQIGAAIFQASALVEQVSGRCKVGRDSARGRNHASISIELADRRAAVKETMCSPTVTYEENFRLPRLAKAV
jgi:hypothetical protein